MHLSVLLEGGDRCIILRKPEKYTVLSSYNWSLHIDKVRLLYVGVIAHLRQQRYLRMKIYVSAQTTEMYPEITLPINPLTLWKLPS